MSQIIAEQWIPVASLRPSPNNPRLFMREERIERIAGQMREAGYDPKFPILVRPLGDVFEVIDGHHRLSAVTAAGLPAALAKVVELDDVEALEAQFPSNDQDGWLPLEIGIGFLRLEEASTVGSGRGNSGGIRGFAKRRGISNTYAQECINAARVYLYCREKMTGQPVIFADKAQHLARIHALPPECWAPMVQSMLAEGWTVKQVQSVVEEARAVLGKVPADWPADGLALLAIAKPREAAMWGAAIEEAQTLLGKLSVVTLYRHEKTEEVVTRGDRDYCVARAIAYEFDARERFRADVADERSATGVRAVYARVLKHIDEHSDSGEKLLPVLGDEEQAAKEARDAAMRDAAMRAAKAAQVECGDCVQWLHKWAHGPIKLLLSDPPYGMAFQSNRRTSTTKADAIAHDGDYNTAMRLTADMLEAAMPHLAEDAHVILFCNDEGLFRLRAVVEAAGLEFRKVLVWVKPNHGSGDLKGFAPRKELAIHAVKGRPAIAPRRDDVFVQAAAEKVSEHPTEKPVSLLREWVECTTEEGDIVCDPFVGTGAAVVAAESLGRAGYGAELDPGYHSVAVQRLLEVSV